MNTLVDENMAQPVCPNSGIMQSIKNMLRVGRKSNCKHKKSLPVADLQYLSAHLQRDLGWERSGIPKRRP